jgi:glycogen synthase
MNKKQKTILMIGWEFPPFNTGGLGIACQGLAEELANLNWHIKFTLPNKLEVFSSKLDFYFFSSGDNFYRNSWRYTYYYDKEGEGPKYNDFISRVYAYRDNIANNIQFLGNFDIIHAHDWLTVPAAIFIKQKTHKPLILHIHALEFDRAGGGNSWKYSQVSSIEREGLLMADKIITVSRYTKQKIQDCYHIQANKIEVVHNGIKKRNLQCIFQTSNFLKNRKIILFVGRLTLQKGVDWFLKAAPLVIERYPKALFVIAGEGEQKERIIKLSFQLGISKNVIFTGFLTPNDLIKLYKCADVYVLPSVSEPFGITPLEAAKYNIPVILSKSSGVNEVLKNVLRVDFWDTQKMAASILSLLTYRTLSKQIAKDAKHNLQNISWKKAAQKTGHIYEQILEIS